MSPNFIPDLFTLSQSPDEDSLSSDPIVSRMDSGGDAGVSQSPDEDSLSSDTSISGKSFAFMLSVSIP